MVYNTMSFFLCRKTLTVPFGLHILFKIPKTGVPLGPINPGSKDNNEQK